MVDIATGAVSDVVDDGKDPVAANMGRKRSAARNGRLTPEHRTEIARTFRHRRQK